MAIAGNTAVIGAWGDDGGTGSAYVFERFGQVWVEQTKLRADDGRIGDGFGRTISIAGDHVVTGTRGSDIVGKDPVAAYVFERSGQLWVELARLLPSEVGGGDLFGRAVSIAGDILVIGAPRSGGSGVAYSYSILEIQLQRIFWGNFESGDTSAWSSTLW